MSAERRGGVSSSLRRVRPGRRTDAQLIFGNDDASLLDIVDNVLNKGVVITGDITLALAQVDLVYARLSLLLCAADRILQSEDADATLRRRARAGRVRRVVAGRST